MEVQIEGLRGIRADFDKAKAMVGKAGDEALQSVGLEIVEEAKRNIERNRTIAFGTLRKSGKVQKDKDGGIDAGFFSADGQQGYAAAVEYGRGPSRKPSPDGITLETTLKAWVHRKLRVPYGKGLDTAAFLIARKIHRKGTKPKPFFVPAVEKFAGKVQQIVDKYIKREIR
jgi:hypothetical protein